MNPEAMNSFSGKVAITGMAGRFPGASDIGAFWHNLVNGVESIRRFSREELLRAGENPALLEDERYVPCNGFLEGIEQFDASFFGMTPKEAEITDPQHRIFLECAWHALEDAGYDAERFDGRIGVFAGAGLSTYLLNNLLSRPDAIRYVDRFNLLMGNNKDYVPTRTSYKLNLTGPSVNVNTACSSSLTAVHLACQSLLDYQCDMALAGGVGIQTPQFGYLYDPNAILSSDGHCRAFDAAATGTVSGNGVGIVVVKRLEDAIEDRDTIYAVLLGTAVNNDGANKVGYTAPSVEGQAEVIAEALEVSQAAPPTIQYVETHGTGTALGDPIEIAALKQAFGTTNGREAFCALGSVKTNIGHLDEAAGVAGLIKTALALRHHTIPPSLHFQTPNPQIDFADSPFFVAAQRMEWARGNSPRRAGVSSFGIGGTNVHVVLEEAPVIQTTVSKRFWHILPLSTREEQALDEAATRLGKWMQAHPDIETADAAYTLQAGRRMFERRRTIVSGSVAECAATIEQNDIAKIITGSADTKIESIVFLYPGQGAQYPDMGLDLYRNEAAYRSAIDRCAEHLLPILHADLRTILLPGEFRANRTEDLTQTRWAQPALFVTGYALTELWRSWGVEAHAAIGHSIGEYAAAYWAGVFSLEDALSAVAERGRLMQCAPSGSMLAVAMPEEELLRSLPPDVSLAAVNSPGQCVVSGTHAAVMNFRQLLEQKEVRCKSLQTSHAFHSAMMDPILEEFHQFLSTLQMRPPQRRLVSNLSGDWITPGQEIDAAYWVSQLRRPVRFHAGIQTLSRIRNAAFIEMGPGRTLTGLMQRSRDPEGKVGGVFCPSLPSEDSEQGASFSILKAVALLWANGIEIDWNALRGDEQPQRISLPGYPFQRNRFWIDAASLPQAESVTDVGSKTPTRKPFEEWFSVPIWKRAILPTTAETDRDNSGYVLFLTESLESAGWFAGIEWKRCVRVYPGEFFSFQDNRCTINPNDPQDYDRLFKALPERKDKDDFILYAWSLDQPPDLEPQEWMHRVVDYPLYLVQTLGRMVSSSYSSLIFLSKGIFDVLGTESLFPMSAHLLGYVRVVPLEYPSIQCRLIDLDESDLSGTCLSALLASEREPPVISMRNRCSWTPSFEPYRVEPRVSKSMPIEANEVYLITGGLSGMGLQLAQWLAKQAPVQLVLISRTANIRKEHPDVAAAIRHMEENGTRISVHEVDMMNEDRVHAMLESVHSSMGAVNGVIHAAGVADGEMIQRRSVQSFYDVISPKTRGLIYLEKALRDDHPKFTVLCSALSGDIGSIGQAAYIAANSFLNAYAVYRTHRYQQNYIAVHWDAWRETGMAANTGLQHPHLRIDENREPTADSLSTNGFDDPVTEASCIVFETVLRTSDHWFLNEHRIGGTAVVPGTAYIELVRKAFQSCIRCRQVVFDNLFFLHPLRVADDEERVVRIVIHLHAPHGFSVVSAQDSSRDSDNLWQIHAQGTIQPLQEESPTPIDLESLLAKDEREPRHPALDHFGNHWHVLEWVKEDAGGAVAKLQMQESFIHEQKAYPLHPAMMDVATGVWILANGFEGAFPFSYRRIRMFAPIEAQVYSLVKRRPGGDDIECFDISICNPQGKRLIEIEEYTLKQSRSQPHSQPRFRQHEAGDSTEKPNNYRLVIGTPGDPQTLHLEAAERSVPATGEVEVQVEAAGLNFKEVLYVYGLFADAPDFELPLGLECAGTVIAVGAGVNRFKPGDRVVVFDASCFQRTITVSDKRVVKLPGDMGFEAGAAQPAALLTAYHALIQRAHLQAGESVLIHAAAGGVGMAAVHIAQWKGANIYATAGSDTKRRYLERQGVSHVMNSRTLDFVDEIRTLTDGKGVDVILNSLSGEFIPASLSVLGFYGRFLEIGVRDIYTNSPLRLAPFERHLSYFAIGVGPEMPGFTETFDAVFALLKNRSLPPIPHRTFDLQDVQSAFDYMAKAKHIGKVVLRFCDVDQLPQEMFSIRVPVYQKREQRLSWSEVISQWDQPGDRHQQDPSLLYGLSNEEGLRVFEFALTAREPQLIVSTTDFHARLNQNHTVWGAIENRDASLVAQRAASALEDTHSISGGKEIERTVKQLWKDFIGIDQAALTDNFYAAGGDSLLAAQMIARVRQSIGADIPLAAFLDEPTLGQLCALAEQAAKAKGNAPVAVSVESGSDMEEGEL